VDFHTRGRVRIKVHQNNHDDAKQPNDIAKESVIHIIQDAAEESGTFQFTLDDLAKHLQVDPNPVGARRHLAGRQNIIMTEWGPWDHVSPRK